MREVAVAEVAAPVEPEVQVAADRADMNSRLTEPVVLRTLAVAAAAPKDLAAMVAMVVPVSS